MQVQHWLCQLRVYYDITSFSFLRFLIWLMPAYKCVRVSFRTNGHYFTDICCFIEKQNKTDGDYLPCYYIFRNYMEEFTSRNAPSMTLYVPFVAGSVAWSLACITCYSIELARTRMQVLHTLYNLKCFFIYVTHGKLQHFSHVKL